MKSLLEKIDLFFFKPQNTKALGLFRIFLGSILLYNLLILSKDLIPFYSEKGVLPIDTLEQVMARPYFTCLTYVSNDWLLCVFFGLLVLAAVFFTLGYHTRLSTILLFILLMSFNERNPFVLFGYDDVVRCMLFFFLFSPAQMAFSLDRRFSGGGGIVPPWTQRMMQIQLAIIYFFSAVTKIHGYDWFQGEALYFVFGLINFTIPGLERLMAYPSIYVTGTYLTLLIEISLVFLLWFKASRRAMAWVGIVFHGLLILLMTIPCFELIMIASYILFFEEDEVAEMVAWARRKSERALQVSRRVFRTPLKNN